MGGGARERAGGANLRPSRRRRRILLLFALVRGTGPIHSLSLLSLSSLCAGTTVSGNVSRAAYTQRRATSLRDVTPTLALQGPTTVVQQSLPAGTLQTVLRLATTVTLSSSAARYNWGHNRRSTTRQRTASHTHTHTHTTTRTTSHPATTTTAALLAGAAVVRRRILDHN